MAEARLQFFGRLAEFSALVGSSWAIDPLGSTLEDLLIELSSVDPRLAEQIASPQFRVAVNDQIVSLAYLVQPNDRVALLPAVTGG
jgi:molybdopterin converting factor small subunit